MSSLTRSVADCPALTANSGRSAASSVPVLMRENCVRTSTQPRSGVGRGIRAMNALLLLNITCRIGPSPLLLGAVSTESACGINHDFVRHQSTVERAELIMGDKQRHDVRVSGWRQSEMPNAALFGRRKPSGWPYIRLDEVDLPDVIAD